MSRISICRVMTICCAAALLLAAPGQIRAECALTDWLFGHGQTTYAPPYCPPTVSAPACGCAPAAPACGCAPAAPACGCAPARCAPTATYRISYRPVPTVAYMPVVGVDPCSGCSVTSYRPVQTWSYQASLQPSPAYYRVGYYAPAVATVGYAGGCGCAPCSGYSSSCGCSTCGASYSGCPSCGTTYSGCSSCNAGVSGAYVPSSGCSSYNAGASNTYVPSSGCSSCAAGSAPLAGTALPGPADMSRSPLMPSTTITQPAPVTIGAPTAPPAIPAISPLPAKTFAPSATPVPIAPNSSGGASGTSYRPPTTMDGGNGSTEPVKIQNMPPLPSGPQLGPTPSTRPENERTTSRAILQASYFQLLPSSPPSVPAQTISAPVHRPRVMDGAWQHVDN